MFRTPEAERVALINMSDYNRAARVYWCAVVAAGAVVGAWAVWRATLYAPTQWAQFLVLLSLVVVCGSRPIRIPATNASVTAGDCFTFLGVIFLGVPGAVLLGAADLLISSMRSSRRATSWIAAPAVMALTAFVAGHAFYFALRTYSNVTHNPVGTAEAVGVRELLPPLVLMALVQYFVNGMGVATLHALKGRRSVWAFWRDGYLWTSWTFFAGALAALVVYEAMMSFGPLYVVLSVPVIAASYGTYKTYFDRVNEKTREAAEINRVHLATVEALAAAIDAKDQTTHCHVRRVQIYAGRTGELLGLSDDEIKALKAGALLHDIGKLAVPDHILNKPGKLTPAEFERMKIHTTVGAQILERVGFPYPVVPIVRHHHEQWGGGGYPEGLRGEEIPITARILSVVDCFDSVREDRPYRPGMTREEASRLLTRNSGTLFDPRVVRLFLDNLDRFEREVEAEGLDRHGFTAAECDARDLLFDPADETPHDDAPPPQQQQALSQAARIHDSDAPAYFNQITNAHREGYALYEIARTFGSSLDIEATVAVLVDKVGHVVPFDLCAVYLYDELKNYATAAHVAGAHAELVRGRSIAPGEGVVGFVLANRRAAAHLDPMLDFADAGLPAGVEFRSQIALPLVREDRVLGALAVYSTEGRRYTDDHLRLLDTVARLASDALANAVQHAEAESNALTDTLTGLPNARAIYARFEAEASRARRTNKPFQVIMLDLDDFKQVNDTFGHQAGDQMLREVARILQAQLREYDFLARYAGDEFIAFVQGLDREQVEELSARIEKAVGRFSLHVRGGRHARVGISVGAATYGTDGETLDQLVLAADEAMYAVKSGHKRLPPAERAAAAQGDLAADAPEQVSDLNTGNLASTAVN